MLNLKNITLFENGEPYIGSAECLRYAEFGAIVNLPALPTYREFNDFRILNMTEHFETEFALCVDSHGFIVNPEAWTDEFLKYDFIGAPIWNGEVGNGGFSLRSKRFCDATATLDISVRDEALLKARYIREKDYHNEDFILCIEKRAQLEAMGLTFAPVELADKFSWSKEGGRVYQKPFGVHSQASLDYIREH